METLKFKHKKELAFNTGVGEIILTEDGLEVPAGGADKLLTGAEAIAYIDATIAMEKKKMAERQSALESLRLMKQQLLHQKEEIN